MSSSINLNVPNLDTENVKASGSLKKHVHYYSLIDQIFNVISKIPEFQRLKQNGVIDQELVLICCNLIENCVKPDNPLDINKLNLCCDVFIKLFNLTPAEVETLKNQVQYLYNNKMIKKIPFLTKASKFVYHYFLSSKT